ncbi:MAG: Trk system potassium uptake protein TrkA [Chlamydiales bacterium]|nr:Trk system potassium uptake protein TrkA [Chlamydiales bacterium]
MRIVFVGAGKEVLSAVKILTENSHEVIIIEEDKDKVDSLQDQFDCGFICGDGSNPDLLQETNPQSVDTLFAISDSDQDNIITGLIGESLQFKRVVVSIRNDAYAKICTELGLENVIIPSQTVGKSLVKLAHNENSTELKDYIKGEVELFKMVISKKEEGPIYDLKLPKDAKPICLYRGDTPYFTSDESELKENDELIILTTEKTLSSLKERHAS